MILIINSKNNSHSNNRNNNNHNSNSDSSTEQGLHQDHARATQEKDVGIYMACEVSSLRYRADSGKPLGHTTCQI